MLLSQLRMACAVGGSHLCDVATGIHASVLCLATATHAQGAPSSSPMTDGRAGVTDVSSWMVQAQVHCRDARSQIKHKVLHSVHLWAVCGNRRHSKTSKCCSDDARHRPAGKPCRLRVSRTV